MRLFIMNKTTHSAERIFTDSKQTFSQLVNAIIHNKIEQLVNNGNKVNTATSRKLEKEQDAS